MGWSCRRPGCHKEAAATIGYDAVGSQVWLDPLGETPSAQMLCQVHAERLRAPRGWVVVDRRGTQTVIMSPQVEPATQTADPPTPKPRRRWGQIEEPTLEFTADPAPAPEPEPEPDKTEEPQEPQEPDEKVDDLGQFLAPTGRLLSRAFSTGGPQRSVLSQDDAPEHD